MKKNKLKLVALFSAICASQLAIAQTQTTTYYMGNDVKHYSTESVTDPITPGDMEETVMAGTIFDFGAAGKNVIHFLNIAGTGTHNVSHYIDIPGYDDERAVDIVGDGAIGAPGSATYYITCLARDPRGNDEIVVIFVDVNGNVLQTRRLADGSQSMYPLHSVYSNGMVYICGYTTTNYTNLPSTPDYGPYGGKRAAFIQFDPTLPPGPLNAAWVMNTALPAAAVPGAQYDYDIATRVVVLNNNNIFVTGSVNDAKLVGANWRYGSGTMNVVFDPTTQALTYDHFISGPGALEYGTGLVEDGTNQVNYVLGNTFYHGYSGSGFFPLPGYMHITGLNSSMQHATTSGNTSRYQLSGTEYGVWGLQTLPADNPANSGPAYKRFTVAGLQSLEFCIKYYQPNFNPYLYDVEMYYDPVLETITHTFNNWVTYQNLTGTGSTAPNSYFYLGGGLSNLAWNPTFAAKPNFPNSEIVLNAPKWTPYMIIPVGGKTGALNLKSIRVDGSFTEINCPSSYTQYLNYSGCPNPYTYSGVEAVSSTTSFDPLSITLYNLTCSASNYDITDDHCNAGNIVYKPSGVDKVEKQAGKTIIYPNPASNDVSIALDKNIADKSTVKLVLINTLGQTAGILYEGSAARLNSSNKLQLPNVASGIYHVQVLVDNKLSQTIKLTVK